jgi:hypothetical protein
MVSGAAVSVAGGRDREVLVECRGVGDKAAYPYYRVDTHILAFCGDARRVALEYPVWCVVTVPSSCGLRSQSHQMTHLPRRHVVRTYVVLTALHFRAALLGPQYEGIPLCTITNPVASL